MARRARRARVKYQEGPRLPDGSHYYKKPSGRRRRKASGAGRTVTSKSGRKYKKTAGGRFVQVSGPKRGKRKGRRGRGRR